MGDHYKWGTQQIFSLSNSWNAYTVSAKFDPAKIKVPSFWARIDVTGGAILVGRSELINIVSKPEKQVSKNLIFNPSFRSGSLGWNFYSHQHVLKANGPEQLRQLLTVPSPEMRGDTLRLYPGHNLRSGLFDYMPGTEYMVRVRMKNAEPGKNATAKLFLIDGIWQIQAHSATLTDEYRDYVFPAKFKASPLNRAYFRCDVSSNPLLLDKVQVTAGDVPGFLPDKPLEFAIRGRNLLYENDRNALLQLRIFRNDHGENRIPLQIRFLDAWGNCFRTDRMDAAAGKEQIVPITVNRKGIRGVFEIEVSGGGEIYRFPFAVLKDLRKLELKNNPLAGHIPPHIPNKKRSDMDAVFGFDRTPYNRFFYRYSVDHPPLTPELQEIFRKHHPFNTICLHVDMRSPYAVSPEVTPALAAAFAELVRKTALQFRGAIQGIELFNEPYLWRIKDGPRKNSPSMSAQKVAAYYRIARNVIDETAPEIKLVGPVAWYDYGKEFLQAGGGRVIDLYTFHNYNTNSDLNDFQHKIAEYRKLFRETCGKDLPMWNDEQYYGINNTMVPLLNDKEHGRRYFADTVIDHAGRCASNLVHHAAANVKWSDFGLEYLWSGLGLDENLIFPAAGTVNAAVEFLSNAGRGEEYPLGEAVKCFVFPKAQNGILVTVHTVENTERGEMLFPKGMRVFDAMGNPIDAGRVILGNAPVYLKFPNGSNYKAELAKLSFRHIGEPFRGRATVSRPDEIAYTIANRLNTNEQIQVTLAHLPKTLQCRNPVQQLSLRPGESRQLKFDLSSTPLQPMTPYEFQFRLKSKDAVSMQKQILTMVLASKGNSFAAIRNWYELNENNLGPIYLPGEKWRGMKDLSAKFGCFWNEKEFGLSVAVTDDKWAFPQTVDGAWKHDSIQIYFDQKRDATPEADRRGRNRSDDVDYTIGWLNGKQPFAFLDRACDIRFIGAANQTRGVDGAVKVCCTMSPDKKLRYDVLFPLETLPYLLLKKGASFGFSLLINDNDGNGRKSSMSLAPKGTEPVEHPAGYLDVLLL